jgi:hypothetical protein
LKYCLFFVEIFNIFHCNRQGYVLRLFLVDFLKPKAKIVNSIN